MNLNLNTQTHIHTAPSDWMALKEELILTKNKLLRKDANLDMLLLSPQKQLELLDASPLQEREHHELFQGVYRHVLRRVLVQYHLAVFHASLIESQGQKKLVRQAIDRYERHINQLFTSSASTGTGTGTSATGTSAEEPTYVRALPQELVGFLLKDLYSYQANNDSDLATRLIQHVRSLQSGNGRYSVAGTQAALQQLLAAWQDLVLEEPTLVQLGYGEHLHPLPEEDAMLRRLSNCTTWTTTGVQSMEEINVSDFGDSSDDDEDQHQHKDQHKHNRHDHHDQDDDDDDQDDQEDQPAAPKRQRLMTWDVSEEEEEQDHAFLPNPQPRDDVHVP
jgi:hypothetical protein